MATVCLPRVHMYHYRWKSSAVGHDWEEGGLFWNCVVVLLYRHALISIITMRS